MSNLDIMYCLESNCLFERKGKKNNKQIDMIQCSFCFDWYHEKCVGVDNESKYTVWPCFECRTFTSTVKQLMSSVSQLLVNVEDLKASNIKTQDALSESVQETRSLHTKCDELVKENREIRIKCDELVKDNREMKTSISQLSLQFDKYVKANEDLRPNGKSLLIGDAVIKDIDQSKLVNTQIECVPSATVAELTDCMNDLDGQFDRIILCIGSNDCAMEEGDVPSFSDAYKRLVDTASQKTNARSSICISSIPPRIDSEKLQQRNVQFNNCLSSLARDNEMTFIDNDSTFKLGNGNPNDGYLQEDGLHLSKCGTNRLAKNLQLRVKAKSKNNVCHPNHKSSPPKHNSPKPNSHDNNQSKPQQQASPEWTEVRYKPRHRNRSATKPNPDRSRDVRCWYCSERNHTKANCRHGQPVICNSCGYQGHKSKFCTYVQVNGQDDRAVTTCDASCDASSVTNALDISTAPRNIPESDRFVIASLNVRGLLSKLDDVALILDKFNLSVFGICETFLDNDINVHEFTISGFKTVFRHRTRHGGGVLMYIKDDVNFDELHVDGDIESVWIKITHEKTPVIVGMKYRPPSA